MEGPEGWRGCARAGEEQGLGPGAGWDQRELGGEAGEGKEGLEPVAAGTGSSQSRGASPEGREGRTDGQRGRR